MRTAGPMLLLLLLSACGSVEERVPPAAPPMLGLEDLLREQASLYPRMRAEDLYKLLHQATMGPAHMFMGTATHLETGLMREVRGLKPLPSGDDEPEIEVINRPRNLARVNLRPFLRHGGKIEDLARAVARTAHEFRGDELELEGTLVAAVAAAKDAGFEFDPGALRRVAREMKRAGYPAGDHTSEYAAAYAPAYRVVLLQFLDDADYGGRASDAAAAPGDSR